MLSLSVAHVIAGTQLPPLLTALIRSIAMLVAQAAIESLMLLTADPKQAAYDIPVTLV